MALAELTPMQQRQVLGKVDPSTCNNPSAVVFANIRALKKEMGGFGGGGAHTAQSQMMLMAMLDPRCQTALAELSPDQQRKILAKVDPSTCRNPSAVVFANIKQLKDVNPF